VHDILPALVAHVPIFDFLATDQFHISRARDLSSPDEPAIPEGAKMHEKEDTVWTSIIQYDEDARVSCRLSGSVKRSMTRF